jgi:type II secretory pathway component GspD/PulD (secretin)
MKFASSLFALALLSPLTSFAQDKTPDTARTEVHTYRVTYTLTDSESGKKVGSQKVAMVLNSGPQSSTIKLGSRVPIATGSYSGSGTTGVQTQFTYLDIGLNINAALRELSNGLEVVTRVEQSGVADAPSTVPHEPVIRQTMLQNSAMLALGKSLLIGSLDIPGSTRHTDIELVVERVP